MKTLYKGLTALGIAALLVGGGVGAYCMCNNNTTEKTVETSNKEKDSRNSKKDTTEQTNTLVNQYAPGSYCVAVEGMRARAAATVNSEVVQSNFQQGVALNIVEVKAGDDDANSVWGRVEDTFQGWICLQDSTTQYLMTPEAYAQSGIKTNASPVYETGRGSGVYDDLGNYVNHTYKVTVAELNVRDAASTSANPVSMMHEGDEVYVEQVKMNQEDGSIWALVNNGWVCIHDQQGNWYMQMQ